jgi:hypothetical protein
MVPSTLSGEASGMSATAKEREIEFVELCRPWSYPEAMLIKATLEQNHVAVLIQGVHSLSVMPHLAFGGQLRLLVDGAQLEYAHALYQAYFESEDGTDYIAEEEL